MIYKNLLISQANEVSQLLNEHIISHNKMLQSAGTVKSLFENVDFSTIHKEIKKVETNFEQKAYELKEIKEEHYGSFADVSMDFFDALENYFNALFEAVKQQSLLSFRLHETSKGSIGNKQKLSWSEYSQLTKGYDEKVKAYSELGDKFNLAYQELESEPNDFIDDEVVEENPILNVLGMEINDIMNKNLYDWAETDLETLEDQIKRATKSNKNKEEAIKYIEDKISYRPDKWVEISEVIGNSSLPRLIKEEFISSVINRMENPIEVLGESIGPDNQPILYRKAKLNKPELARQLKSIAKAWHEGDVRSAILALESDLEHG